ncbi:MAG: iron-sulfur cluster repair di-iron protein [Balneolaceae bacterium]|nr:MAG: iron-sulfur cluster repair di-iron protein [Balneolaceae bacterium]
MSLNNNQFNITPEASVGEIVAKNFNAASVFRQFNIDFCCGGGISLQEACDKKNIYVDEILSELSKLDSNSPAVDENFLAWEADYLIDYIIRKHHSFVRQKTDEIGAYSHKVASVHGERHPENIEIYHKFTELTLEMMTHLESEEDVVFPLISKISKKRKSGEKVSETEIYELKKQLTLMVSEHEGAGSLIAEISDLSNQFTPPYDACTTYRILYQNLEAFEQDLHRHIHLENNILFKKAEELV